MKINRKRKEIKQQYQEELTQRLHEGVATIDIEESRNNIKEKIKEQINIRQFYRPMTARKKGFQPRAGNIIKNEDETLITEINEVLQD